MQRNNMTRIPKGDKSLQKQSIQSTDTEFYNEIHYIRDAGSGHLATMALFTRRNSSRQDAAAETTNQGATKYQLLNPETGEHHFQKSQTCSLSYRHCPKDQFFPWILLKRSRSSRLYIYNKGQLIFTNGDWSPQGWLSLCRTISH